MALAVRSAAPLKPEIKLAQAISEFEAVLRPEDKVQFRNYKTQSAPDVQDVLRLTTALDREDERKSRRRKPLGPRLTSLLHVVQQFSSAVDVVVGGAQNMIASGVWGAMRLMLQVCSESAWSIFKLTFPQACR